MEAGQSPAGSGPLHALSLGHGQVMQWSLQKGHHDRVLSCMRRALSWRMSGSCMRTHAWRFILTSWALQGPCAAAAPNEAPPSGPGCHMAGL